VRVLTIEYQGIQLTEKDTKLTIRFVLSFCGVFCAFGTKISAFRAKLEPFLINIDTDSARFPHAITV
jgi:hypothetical protein